MENSAESYAVLLILKIILEINSDISYSFHFIFIEKPLIIYLC